MSRYLSPLRYPGGKASIAPALLEDIDAEVWFEPFSGGAGVGLRALFDGVVEELWLAESDPVVRGLWEWIIDDAESLAEAVERLRPDLDLFYRSRQIIAGGTAEVCDLVLAGLVVNRCSHSGIIAGNVGPVGGKSQSGKYTVAARFDPDALARRIRLLAPLASRMRMVGADGIEALESLATSGADDDVVVFADPPYKMDCAAEILSLVAARGLLEEGGAVVYESEREENAPAGWELYDLRNYGRTKISFFRQVQGE